MFQYGGRDAGEEWMDGWVVVHKWNARRPMERKDGEEGTDRSTKGFEEIHQVRLIGSISRFLSHPRHGSDSSLVRPSNVLPCRRVEPF